MAQQSEPKTNKTNKTKLIGQGSYGCVYYPGIKCNGKTENLQYVTKVQHESQEVIKEKEVGEQIRKRKIKKYYDYFAPVISSCPLKIGLIEKDELNQCNVLQTQPPNPDDPNDPNDQPKFVSVKIRYVGKQTLKEHLLERLITDTPTFFGHMIETLLYLCYSLDKLIQANVIHYDLKSNNIMFHEKIQNPVIIDFGMSILINKITKQEYSSTFFDHYEKYPPWCVDIVIVSFLVKKEYSSQTKITKEDTNTLKTIVNKYFAENPTIVHIENSNTKNQNQKQKITKYWIDFVESKQNKTCEKVVTELLENWKTWDTYSLIVIYYRFMKENVKMKETAPFVDSYLEILETYILAKPTDRKEPLKLRKELLDFSKKIPKSDFLKWNQKMTNYQKDPSVVEAEKESVQKDLDENKKIENTLFEKKRQKKTNPQT